MWLSVPPVTRFAPRVRKPSHPRVWRAKDPALSRRRRARSYPAISPAPATQAGSAPGPSGTQRDLLAQLPRLLSLQDREPASRTYGCFDRDHWSWKFRDLPLGMMQLRGKALAVLLDERA